MLMCSSKIIKQECLKHIKQTEAEPEVSGFMSS